MAGARRGRGSTRPSAPGSSASSPTSSASRADVVAAAAGRGHRPPGAARRRSRPARPRPDRRPARAAAATPTASPTRRPSAPSRATSPTRRISSPYPRDEADVAAAARLGGRGAGSPSSPSAAARRSWAASSRSSATGSRATVSLDLRASTACSRSTRPAAPRASRPASAGPAIEAALKPHGLAIRHYPQSFEFSTLGGWIATRSGGHFATLYTHIDDFVESLRTVTPAGVMESRRLPGSGAGPSPDRHDDRLGRGARRHHRGLDAAAGPAALPGRRRVRLPRPVRRRQGGARRRPRPGSIRRTCASSTTTRPAPTASTTTRRAC